MQPNTIFHIFRIKINHTQLFQVDVGGQPKIKDPPSFISFSLLAFSVFMGHGASRFIKPQASAFDQNPVSVSAPFTPTFFPGTSRSPWRLQDGFSWLFSTSLVSSSPPCLGGVAHPLLLDPVLLHHVPMNLPLSSSFILNHHSPSYILSLHHILQRALHLQDDVQGQSYKHRQFWRHSR